jgi:glycosyltransferase involved in cell wall biosynthesis
MKIAHIAIVTPRRCGLYETTRELVLGLRYLGKDSRIVDPQPSKNPIGWRGDDDRGVPVDGLDWAKDADVLINHSGLGELEKLGKPVIHIAHGRPRHSFLSETSGSTPIYSYHFRNNQDKNLKAVVTFWSQHKPYLEVMYPDKPVHAIQSPVDLGFWCPGPTKYDFADQGGGVNIVCTDAFRDDIDAYDPINAYALWARQNKQLNPKLHIFGKPRDMRGWGALIKRVQLDGNMGIVQGWASELQHVYSAADLVLTAHTIDVRTVREATACGCPVARVTDISDIDKITTMLNADREAVRQQAVERFDYIETAKQFRSVLECSL